MSNEHLPDKPFEGLGAETAAAALAAFAFTHNPGDLAAATASPFMSRIFRLSQKEFQSNSRRAQSMWDTAGSLSGQPVEQLFEAAETDEDKLHLASSASIAAGKSRSPEKLNALAQALAQGLLAETHVELDHEQEIVDALDALERGHLVVLNAMIESIGSVALKHRSHSIDERQLLEIAGDYAASLPRIMAALEREGLVSQSVQTGTAQAIEGPAQYSFPVWTVTTFGLEVMERLRHWEA